MEMNHVLVVEDDKEIREGVEIYLSGSDRERGNPSCNRRYYDAADGWNPYDDEASGKI